MGFLLGTVQGLNFVLLFALLRALIVAPSPAQHSGFAAVVAGVGVLGGGHLSLVGTTYYDNVVSLAVIGTALIVAASASTIFAGPMRSSVARTAVAGLVLGAGAGLKLPTAVFAVGFCAAFLVTAGSAGRRFGLAFAFGFGVLGGMAIFAGPWMWYLWTEYDNPLFPYFNEVFRSPMGLPASYRDTRFIPQSLWETLAFPFLFSFDPYRVGEIVFRDFRILAAYGALLATPFIPWGWRRAHRSTAPAVEPLGARYVIAAAALSYAAWIPLFSIYRYILSLEMLAPVLVTAAVGLWPVAPRARVAAVATALAVVAVTAKPGSWGRLESWTERFVEVEAPALPRPDATLVVITGFEPVAFVIPAFPPPVAFVRLQGYLNNPDDGDTGLNRRVRERLARHGGDIYLLFSDWGAEHPDWAAREQEITVAALLRYGLAADFGACRPVTANLADYVRLCPVARRSGQGTVRDRKDAARMRGEAAAMTSAAPPSPSSYPATKRRPPSPAWCATSRRRSRTRRSMSTTTTPPTAPPTSPVPPAPIVRPEPLQGKGNVVRRMFADVEADVYVLVDGDDTYDAASAPGLVRRLLDDGLDMVNAARVPTAEAAYRPGHRFGNRMLTSLVALVFGKRTTDMLSGYRVFSRRFVEVLPGPRRGLRDRDRAHCPCARAAACPSPRIPTAFTATSAGLGLASSRTFQDGFRILWTIAKLVKEERPDGVLRRHRRRARASPPWGSPGRSSPLIWKPDWCRGCRRRSCPPDS